MFLIDLIAGARPNFMKIAPIISSIKKYKSKKIKYRLIHTGQHYDKNMSQSFFNQLGIPEPDFNLESGGGTQAEITSKIMVRYESLLVTSPSDLCLVVGDVTSTMACSIVAKKQKIKVAHVEAGIRSWDLTMPEEINRMVTDSITDYFFTTSKYANSNLLNLGVPNNKIFFVGNTMIDSLLKNINKLRKPYFWNDQNLINKKYIVMTLHRPSNVDNKNNLQKLIHSICESINDFKLLFPVHPRTKNILKNLKINDENLVLIDPLPYLEFNYLIKNSLCVITDSGGITEETTVLGIPCITIRENTERPETIEIGTNELIGTNLNSIKKSLKKIFSKRWKKGSIPPLWDGKASDRIVKYLIKIFENQ